MPHEFGRKKRHPWSILSRRGTQSRRATSESWGSRVRDVLWRVIRGNQQVRKLGPNFTSNIYELTLIQQHRNMRRIG